MQLIHNRKPAAAPADISRRREQLSLAVCALLGGAGASQAVQAADSQATVIDSGFLWYSESDSRIRDAEAIINVRQPLAEDRAWTAHLTFDTVCGGSPIGAAPRRSVQNFFTPTATTLTPQVTSVQTTTSSSGGGGGGGLDNLSLCTNPVVNQHYSTAAGQLPIDQSFKDQRVALSGGYETSFGSTTHLTGGVAASHETDFLSFSANGSLAQDFNGKNTTVSLGLNAEADSINPVGHTPVAGSAYGLFQKTGDQSKHVATLVLGATQVMTRRWLTQGTLSVERSSGYETDPYKIVSLLDSQGYASTDPYADYVYERRPDSRNRWGLFWDNRIALDHDTIQMSYRHTQDTWGVRSDTFDARYRFSFGSHGYLEPHLREYHQTAADFFHFYLDNSTALPAYFSADPRLASFHGQTFGLKYGIPMDDTGGELSFRIERYTQRGSTPGGLPAGLQGLDMYPGMSALIAQIGARWSF